jgi:hypothetical protein
LFACAPLKVVLFQDNTTYAASGFTGDQLHNVYGFAFQKMFHQMFANRGQRSWMQSRGNFLGGQASGQSLLFVLMDADFYWLVLTPTYFPNGLC